MGRINSKAEFFRLWQAGALGFRLRTWGSIEEYLGEPNKPPVVGFRQIGVAGGGKFEVVNASYDVAGCAVRWTDEGRKYMICEAAPDHLATIQGEVRRGTSGWEGFLAWPVKDGKRMRDSMRDDARDVRGLLVKHLLDHYLSPPSRDDLDALLDLYPDAVVEFTAYGPANFDRGRNTIFWEVRNY